MGLSVDEINDYLTDGSNEVLNKKLVSLRKKVEQRIQSLEQILIILRQKENKTAQLTDIDFYTAQEIFYKSENFSVQILQLIVLSQKLHRHMVIFIKKLVQK